MFEIQATKRAIMLPPQLKDDGDFAGNSYVDTAGFGHLRVEFIVGTTDADIGSTGEDVAPKLEECDTTDGTYTAITGAALAAPISGDGGNVVHAIDLDLRRTHRRYVQVNAPHAGAGVANGANLCIVGLLSEPQIAPVDAGGQGLAEHITA